MDNKTLAKLNAEAPSKARIGLRQIAEALGKDISVVSRYLAGTGRNKRLWKMDDLRIVRRLLSDHVGRLVSMDELAPEEPQPRKRRSKR